MLRKVNMFKSSGVLLTAIGLALIIVSTSLAAPVIISGGPENDYESWIARLSDGRLMVIFDRNPDWASGDLYVSFSSDDGATWTSPQVVISETGDQATLSFVQMPDDTIWLWYASNQTGSYGIYEAWSTDGINWNQQGAIDLGWGTATHYDPNVILEPDGSLTMSYVVSGSGVYIAHKPAGGQWDTDRTRVSSSGFRARVMRHNNGTYLYAYHKRTGGQYDYDVFTTTSVDRINWTTHGRLTTNLNSHDPFPCQMPDGSYMVYYAKYESPAYNLCRRKSFDGINWESEEQITNDNTNNTQPHFFTDYTNLYLVWAHAVSYPYDHDVYFERFALDAPPVSVEMIPDNTPVTVNPGGYFTFTGILANNTQQYAMGDVWIMLGLPGGSQYGPIGRFDNIPLSPGQQIVVNNVRQDIPAYAPLGTYNYTSYAGMYPSIKIDSSTFEFTVVAPASGTTDEWILDGWFDGEGSIIPVETSLSGNYPNPFNAITTVEYQLRDNGHVKLEVFNLKGQLVQTLFDGYQTAGHKSVMWDASTFSSGIYFYCLTADDYKTTKRMTLMK
ncbi:MAG: T9SS type A sorting domain-containing protein [candidate division Zixibacteria bacterium]|nr:T9SS type A sorting domain-containing protein [candidate division Zixibacteria bacterium]